MRDRSSTSDVSYHRAGTTPSGLVLAEARLTDRFADGAMVDEPPDPSAPLVWRSVASETGALRVHVPSERLPQAPELWFVEVDEPRATPAACNLVAFATDHHDPGAIVSRYAFATMGVHNDTQAGALRWYRNGRIHQIFVNPAWRRRSVARALLHAADAWQKARGWPGHLHADGRRTKLGDVFAAAMGHPRRFAPLSEEMPPMDPGPARRR